MPAEIPAAAEEAAPLLELDSGIEMDFVLNAEAVDSDSDDDSSEMDEDDDDDDD